ncbi:MAG: phospholipase D family protein [Noviherbaspirillum sp.]
MAGYRPNFNLPTRRARLEALALAGLLLLAGCASLPSLQGRPASSALTDTVGTRLGQVLEPLSAAHPGRSAIYPLLDARDAFAARAHLAQVAERSLDVQYYIWHKDMTGTLLFDALRAAADRGVRVRLLLDDNNTAGLDPVLAALDAHPNIEVRLFNPFVLRSPRWLGYLTDFRRANRRMHNKSYTADNQVTIIGGRNVGDEYFGAAGGMLFSDLDVMAAGPVVRAVSEDFDRYWQSLSSYPAALLLPPADPAALAGLAAQREALAQQPAMADYNRALRESPFVRDLARASLPLEWAPTRMVSDDPAKGLGLAPPDSLVRDKLRAIIGEPASRVSLVSPYFVPSDSGVAIFTELAQRGVDIEILTNALEATDVAAVHAGYAKRRRALLAAGVRLYELRRLAAGVGRELEPSGMGSSSATSLHAKTFAVDHARLFVGSFNFDQRSVQLNTEMGFVIDSPALAQKLHDLFALHVPEDAYRVTLEDHGKLVWTEQQNGRQLRHESEPGVTGWQRFWVWLLSLLPIDSLL